MDPPQISQEDLKILHHNRFCSCVNGSDSLLELCNAKRIIEQSNNLLYSLQNLTSSTSYLKAVVRLVNPRVKTPQVNKRANFLSKLLKSQEILNILGKYINSNAAQPDIIVAPVNIPPPQIVTPPATMQLRTRNLSSSSTEESADEHTSFKVPNIPSLRRSTRLIKTSTLSAPKPPSSDVVCNDLDIQLQNMSIDNVESPTTPTKRKLVAPTTSSEKRRKAHSENSKGAQKNVARELFGDSNDLINRNQTAVSTPSRLDNIFTQSMDLTAETISLAYQDHQISQIDTAKLHSLGFCFCNSNSAENCRAGNLASSVVDLVIDCDLLTIQQTWSTLMYQLYHNMDYRTSINHGNRLQNIYEQDVEVQQIILKYARELEEPEQINRPDEVQPPEEDEEDEPDQFAPRVLLTRQQTEAKKMEDKIARDLARRLAGVAAAQVRAHPPFCPPEEDYNVIVPYSVGPMNIKCAKCKSNNFAKERASKGHFTFCCENGKVQLQPLHPIDDIIKNLLTENNAASRNFRENIRHYNSAMATASWSSDLQNPIPQRVNPPGRGPYCFGMQGGVYHYVSNLYPPEGRSRSYGQLYILDTDQATQERMLRNSNIDKHGTSRLQYNTLSMLHQYMMHVNPYAKQLFTMHEKMEQEKLRAAQEGRPVIKVRLEIRNAGMDPRRYNAPLVADIAAIFDGSEEGQPTISTCFAIYPRPRSTYSGSLRKLYTTNPNIDPMTYPILFPHGDLGWHLKIPHVGSNATKVRNKVTLKEFTQFRLANRDEFSALHSSGKLFQQYLVNAAIRQEGSNLDYIRKNQVKLRGESYRGLQDYLANRAETGNLRVGKPVILPSSYQGSPRAMQQCYQDAMAMVSVLNHPSLFITFTANPDWPEIKASIKSWEEVHNRPDIIDRVFNLKLKQFLQDLTEDNVFGPCTGYVYCIEAQKRGLMHAHIVIWLNKIVNDPEEIDRMISAEIPDKTKHPRLFELVKRHMIHGPCGKGMRANAPCLGLDGKSVCNKSFPKKFEDVTRANVNGYPLYRRRKSSPTLQIDFNHVPTDVHCGYVVPYSPVCLLKYEAHINVEVCASIKCLKYLFKYIFKGHDCASVVIIQDGIPRAVGQPVETLGVVEDNRAVLQWDEIKVYLDSRYVGSGEAAWRIFGFKLHGQSHTIYRLAVHVPLEQYVVFVEGQELDSVALLKETTLTAWFELNTETETDQEYLISRKFLYTEIPQHYKFKKCPGGNKWTKRVYLGCAAKVIPRMYFVNPRDSERYHLRMLLLHVRGATSFEDMRTVDGIIYETFKDACMARNLLQDDSQWVNTMKDAIVYQTGVELRNLFVIILHFNRPTNALALWNQFKVDLSSDFAQHQVEEIAENMCLDVLFKKFAYYGVTLQDFKLPNPDPRLMPSLIPGEDQQIYDICNEIELGHEQMSRLNQDQKNIADRITALVNDPAPGSKCLFIDGPAGSGKTTLYQALVHSLRGQGKQVICTAFSGIAALQLPGGRTVHSTFKLPFNFSSTSCSSISANSPYAHVMKSASVIIWDEAAMSHKDTLKIVDGMLRDICDSDLPFAGKVFVLGGDFRQTLPVVPRATSTQQMEASIKKSSFWPEFETMTLTENMRASRDPEFAEFLLKVGNGELNLPELGEYAMELPRQCIVKSNIVQEIFGTSIDTSKRDYYNKCILCPTNEDTFELNAQALNLIDSPERVYLSADSAESGDSEEIANYPPEFLHSLTPTGLPLHKTVLKIGCTIMLLTNLRPTDGLCNGSRFVVKGMTENILYCENITAGFEGRMELIPRLWTTSDDRMPFTLKRFQFPVRLSFAMTVNKSQGQTMDMVGLFLRKPVFSHGQLYVAMSRARCFNTLKIRVYDAYGQGVIHRDQEDGDRGSLNTEYYYTQNIVHQEILRR